MTGYRKPAAALKAVGAPEYDKQGNIKVVKRRALAREYKGFVIEKCTLGGWRVMFKGQAILTDQGRKKDCVAFIDGMASKYGAQLA